VAKVGTSKPDRTISLKRLQYVVENNSVHIYEPFNILGPRRMSFSIATPYTNKYCCKDVQR